MSYDLRIIMSIWVTLLGKSVKHVIQKLKEMYGNIENAWFSEEGLWERVADEELRKKAIEIYEECIKNGIKIVLSKDERYPSNLKEIENYPYLLYYRGKLPADADIPEEMLLSVVGSRNCTSYGRVNAYNFSKSLAECGLGIVSGMARGIDAQAHKGALFSKGYTIAVLGSGLGNVYPKEHLKLFDEIAENGCVVSEFPPKMPPFKNNFPARNRIISGLSQGLLVVEASEKSGAMITVNYALEEGRNVFAIPGNINSEKSYGCNFLIKQGALCVTSYTDILEEYNVVCDSAEKIRGWIKGLEGAESDVVNAIIKGAFTANDISKETERNMGNVLSALTMLEIKGIVTKGFDGTYVLKM
ncbi:MAG: DNA-protecting protein DprA [Ruminococcaceae bacterium]|nr:DNA-protecting protein DprA [Oscillospiraceae bacterium]